jgi:hypothetical protein
LIKGKCRLEDVNVVWELIWRALAAQGRTSPVELAKVIGDRRYNLVAGNTANSIYGTLRSLKRIRLTANGDILAAQQQKT